VLSDQQLLRYSRQIMLDDVDLVGQQALLDASVLIVGLGGLGCPAAMYLASSGVGQLLLADDDVVDLSNLQRQIAHATSAIGMPKVASAKATLLAINPDVEVEAIAERLQGEALAERIAQVDLVVDASDNFATRFALNAACVAQRKPLVYGAAIRGEAQLSVFDSRRADSPCYRCLYSDSAEHDDSCARNGVLAPLVGIIGSALALEALKLLAGFGEPLVGRLQLLDARRLEWRELILPRDPACPVCNRAG
jgi:molybdopterin/thiamine biosynthesis adenylyltransferase